MGFSHESDGLNTTLLSQSCVLGRWPPLWGQRVVLESQGQGGEPLTAQGQLTGQRMVSVAQGPPATDVYIIT